jgi:uncharacterized membrane protein
VRRSYLDWLRGIAVLIMIEAHTIDAWTRVVDRTRPAFSWALVLGGFGAPLFLFLAGAALALASGARVQRGMSAADAAARARRRGWQIFGLAFLFRLQSWIISQGEFLRTLLKVDILNIMGPSMIAAAWLWKLGRTTRARALLLGAAACAVAMLTPIVRASPLIDLLPDPVEWYLRPSPGHTTFTIFPWTGFLLAGGVVGLILDRVSTARDEARANLAFAIVGGLVAIGGYAASFLPPIYAETSFWTSSPTFFFLRLGILIAAVPLAYLWSRLPFRRAWSPLEEFGVASLFVYWIHVEMVYGTPSLPIHHRLTLEQWPIAYLLFTAFLFGLVKLKSRLTTAKTSRTVPITALIPDS